MAKAASGEVSLKLGAEEYLLRLDFRAIAEIEDALDSSIILIANEMASGAVPRVGRMCKILMHMCQDPILNIEDAGQLFMEHGEAVGDAISKCFRGTLSVETPGKSKEGRKAKKAKA